MKLSGTKKLLAIFVLISVVAALFQIGIRISAEKRENTIDIAADYYTFQTFANSYGYSVFDAIKELKNYHLTSISVPEQNINDLINNGNVSLYSGSNLLTGDIPERFTSNIDFSNYKGTIKSYYSIIFTKSKALADRINNTLIKGTFEIHGNNLYAIITPINQLNLINYGVGFDDKEIEQFKSLGLQIVLRPRYAPGNRNLKILEDTLKKFNIHTVMFYGNMINGSDNPDNLNELANFFNQNKIVTYIIELPIQKGIYDQEGIKSLIKKTNYYVARVYSIYPAEQLKLKPFEIFNRWFRAVSDRNIRVIYVKPIIDAGKSYEQNMTVNDYYINKFYNLWTSKGMQFGIPSPMPKVNRNIIVDIFIALGIIALFMLYMEILFDMKDKDVWIWFTLLSILAIGLLIVKINATEKLFALSAAILITGMFSLILFEMLKKIYGSKQKTLLTIIKKGILYSLIMFTFSLIGGIWIGAILGSSSYMLNLDMFRGVKLLYLTPFIFLKINYLYEFGADFNNAHKPKEKYNLIEEIEKAWHIPVNWGHITILILLAGIFLVYLLRSGNTGVQISSIELKFRAMLEHTIVARPRIKEFVVGYPSLFITILFTYLMRKKWLIAFSILSIMGSISIVDTFSHLRDTFLMSLYRGLYGILFGIIIGIFTIVIFYVPITKIFRNAD
jgi:hypothetical protein